MLSANEARLDDMVLTLFGRLRCTRGNRVCQPVRHVLVEQRVVFGEDSVRVVNDDFEFTESVGGMMTQNILI